VRLSPARSVVDDELKSVRVGIAIAHFASVIHCPCRLLLSYRRSLSHYRRRPSRSGEYHARPIFLSPIQSYRIGGCAVQGAPNARSSEEPNQLRVEQ